MSSAQIEDIRKQVRKLEAEIAELKSLPSIPRVITEIQALYDQKWALEREVRSLATVVHIGQVCAK